MEGGVTAWSYPRGKLQDSEAWRKEKFRETSFLLLACRVPVVGPEEQPKTIDISEYLKVRPISD
jgi:hypothetical protein